MERNLPIYNIRDKIKLALSQTNQLILHAPTGSGKSTLVPQFLIDDVLLDNETVIVLQPRRLAARLLSAFISKERGGVLGDEVGFQVRLEGKQSEKTKILFVTEGVLLNRLFTHDILKGIGAIVFDEFHERHLETDLCLAMALKLQNQRPDLKIVVMSATLEIDKVQRFLTKSQTQEAQGKTFPVTIEYQQPKPYESIWNHTANVLEAILPDFQDGSALVFMPGVYEIRKTIEAIQKKPRLQHFEVLPLYSSLSATEQDKAVQPGGRKIIVTTNVAETSITLPGITLVLDSGLARIARFDPKRGINTLFTENISKSSCNQRTGRAGRVAPGRCIRLWSEFSHDHRQDSNLAEIHRLDLSETLLNLLAAGESPETFPWIETPAKVSFDNAFQLLQKLEAVDTSGRITSLGIKLASYGVQPRLARMLFEAEKLGCLPAAAVLVAITQTSGLLYSVTDEVIIRERMDLFAGGGSDLIFELNAYLWAGSHQFKTNECNRLGVNANRCREIGKLAIQILRRASVRDSHVLPQLRIDYDEALNLRKCIFAGFSDFLAIRHRLNSPTCQMMLGKSGQLHRDSSVQDARFMVVNEMEETKTPTGIQVLLRKVTEIEEEWLNEDLLKDLTKNISYEYNKELKRVQQITELVYNQLIIRRELSEIKDNDVAAEILTKAILNNEIDFPQWNEDVEHFVRRVNFAALHAPHYGIPAIREEEKEFIIQQSVYKCRSLKDIQKCDVWPSLKAWLSYEQMEAVKYLAPEFIELPHKKRPVKLRYDEKGDVILSETIQALYDCPLPLTVAEGKVQVIFELLAPSRRPVQITRDLEYFWKNSYYDVKKELKGRYPKHEWR
jgi:ATP-dependent helicase HrpB